MSPEAWAPLGAPGEALVRDAFARTVVDTTSPPPSGRYDRCELAVAGHRVRFGFVPLGESYAERLADQGGAVEQLARATTGTYEGPGGILWRLTTMTVQLADDEVTHTRGARGRDRWELVATSAAGRAWTWRPVGRVLAHRLELVRRDDEAPVTVYRMRPVPGSGRKRDPEQPDVVSWSAEASLAEVVLTLMWALGGVHHGILPKTQQAVSAWTL